MDWKKEYHASDLFRRKKAKDTPAPPPDATEASGPTSLPAQPAPEGAAEQTSVWKKEVKVSDVFRRSKKATIAAETSASTTPAPEPAPATPAEPVDLPPPAEAGPASPEAIEASPDAGEPSLESEPTLPELQTERPATEVVGGGSQSNVWKKEIRIGELFRRRKAPEAEQPGSTEIASRSSTDLEPVEAPASDLEGLPVEASASEPARHEQSAEQEEGEEHSAFEPPAGDSVAGAVPDEPEESAPATGSEPPSPEPELGDVEEPEAFEPEPEDAEPMAPEADATAPAETGEDAPEPPAPQGSMWKKEIKVSDLFRRGKKTLDEPVETESEAEFAEPEAEPAQAAPVPTSVWKKEIRLAPRRGPKPDRSSGREGPRRRLKRERPVSHRAVRAEARGSRTAGGLPDVPLVRALNLLPRDEAKTRSARLPSLATAGVALAGLVVVGGLAFAFLHERSRVADREGALEDVEAQVAAIQAPAQVAPEAGTQLAGEALARAGALSAALDGRFVWDRLLRKLSLVLPDDVWFETVQSTPAETTVDPATGLSIPGATTTITINGYSKTQTGLAQLVGRLDVLPELGSVQLQSGTVIERGGQDVVQFTVAATLERPREA
jgi:Tfp pilus assembly protein PilN